MNNAAITICVQVLCEHVFNFLGYIPRSAITGSFPGILKPNVHVGTLCELISTTDGNTIHQEPQKSKK